jgi:hypothetical protein
MMLKREATPQKPRSAPWLRRFGAAALATGTALAVAAGCLQRPVEPQDPTTSNLFVDQIVQTAVDKIDLLFMIDNSISMADKQRILRDAVPVLVQRLVTPACVDVDTGEPTGSNTGSGPCPNGTEAEFAAIRDIHIGIVTSSLGDMGSGEACSPGVAQLDDKGQLIATTGLRPMMLDSWNGQGFLAWDPDAAMGRPRNMPGGTTDAQDLISDFSDMVTATGEQGCGYEASLEAWYRFLIDPQPPGLVQKDANGFSAAGPPDATILAQRAAFLRPDSLVAIIMLTDENDCSIIDYNQGWVVGLQDQGNFFMPRATSTCNSDPNSKCCFSCSADPRNIDASCTPPSADSECAKGVSYTTLVEDHPNLRCYQQKRRFGFDLLQPLSRYVDGLTRQNIYVLRKPDTNGDGKFDAADAVPNPLFEVKDGKRRDASLVFLAGIVGVPWQDIADEASWADSRRLRYLRYDEMVAAGRWDWILANGTAPPKDGLMFETTADRTTVPGLPQAHPAGAQVGGKIEAATVMTRANPINGHETNINDGGDLQYACTFPLTNPIDCGAMGAGRGCDCQADDQVYNRSLCEGMRQTHAKAFPGTRHLEVLKQFGDITGNSIVASICPKVSTPQGGNAANDPNYGYNPAVSAIIDRLKEALKGKCLPRPLEVAANGEVPCVVVEARLPETPGACGSCDDNQALPGRKTIASPAIVPEVHTQLAEGGFCGQAGKPACTDYCMCEIQQYTGDALRNCQTDRAEPTNPKGYCYVESGELLAKCPASQPQLLRFATDVPQKGAVAFIACLGKALGTATAAP